MTPVLQDPKEPSGQSAAGSDRDGRHRRGRPHPLPDLSREVLGPRGHPAPPGRPRELAAKPSDLAVTHSPFTSHTNRAYLQAGATRASPANSSVPRVPTRRPPFLAPSSTAPSPGTCRCKKGGSAIALVPNTLATASTPRQRRESLPRRAVLARDAVSRRREHDRRYLAQPRSRARPHAPRHARAQRSSPRQTFHGNQASAGDPRRWRLSNPPRTSTVNSPSPARNPRSRCVNTTTLASRDLCSYSVLTSGPAYVPTSSARPATRYHLSSVACSGRRKPRGLSPGSRNTGDNDREGCRIRFGVRRHRDRRLLGFARVMTSGASTLMSPRPR